jgi:2-dehydro-3-deoxyphosphogluconate aldolase/(4S)-4-hydroxy-2-oxoglutarate aldolase
MTRESTLSHLLTSRLVVVARHLAPEHAGPIAEALIDARTPALEITLDDPSALPTIAQLHARFGNKLLLGAGTALRPSDAEAAIAAGASYIVSPVFIPAILDLCNQSDILYFPGAITPNEMFKTLDAGARGIKIFPSSMISPQYIYDVLEPLRTMHPIIMLTGSLKASQISAYLAAGVSIVGLGRAILNAEEITSRQYDRIGARARSVLMEIQGASKP